MVLEKIMCQFRENGIENVFVQVDSLFLFSFFPIAALKKICQKNMIEQIKNAMALRYKTIKLIIFTVSLLIDSLTQSLRSVYLTFTAKGITKFRLKSVSMINKRFLLNTQRWNWHT